MNTSGIIQKVKFSYSKFSRIPVGTVLKKAPYRLIKQVYSWKRKIFFKPENRDVDSIKFQSFKSSCVFLFSTGNREHYVKFMKESGRCQAVLNAANRSCRHIFDILGSGERFLGDSIPWTTDFKTGHLWRNQYYQDIKTVHSGGGADVKVPWELSRCQHFFILGKAYWLSGDPGYALEFRDQCISWMESNPVEMTVNWICPMEAAIRAMNWIAGYWFFQDAPVISGDFWVRFYRMLFLHGCFIFANLENRGMNTNNHYIANLAGLIWLGLFFGNFTPKHCGRDNPSHWLTWGLAELDKEILVQINPDGTDYETSTYYHRFVAEMLLLTSIFCGRNNLRLTDESLQRLERMGEFLADAAKPNELTPLIGDADDGMVFPQTQDKVFGKVPLNDFRFILALMGEWFNRDDFRFFGSPYYEEAVLLMGAGNVSRKGSPPLLKSKAYRDGGFYILRHEKIYCMIRCGPLSCRGEGGHSHNDQLSVEVNIHGEDIFIDPGTCVYSANFSLRNQYRSTQSHSTLCVGGSQQNDFNPDDLFFMREQTFSECLTFTEKKFIGRHFGYQKKYGVIHQRQVEIDQYEIRIIDSLTLEMPRFDIVEQNFILAPGVTVQLSENMAYLGKGNVSLIMKTDGMISSEEFQISPSYGVLEPSRKLTVKNGFKNSCHSAITIRIL